jgi:opacity protein-like surface antigen
MQKKLLLINILFTIVMANCEATEKKLYLNAYTGGYIANKFNQLDYAGKRPKNQFLFGFGMGAYLNSNLSAGIDFYHFPSGKVKSLVDDEQISQRFKASATFMQLTYAIPVQKQTLIPFVSLGIGNSINDSSNYRRINANKEILEIIGRTKNQMAFNFGLGLQAKLDDNLMFSLGYRHYNLGKIQTSSVEVTNTNNLLLPSAANQSIKKAKLAFNSIVIGLSYIF